MAKYPFIVDGQDFTDLFHKTGYEVSYEFREGENGGLMCSGDELRDLLAVKPTIVGTTKRRTDRAHHRAADGLPQKRSPVPLF